METCLLNPVLCVALVVLLAVPSTLEAWTYTPSGNDMDRAAVTGGYYSFRSTGPEELTAVAEKVLTPRTTSDFRERFLSTGGNVPQRHTDETQTLTEENIGKGKQQ